MVGNLPINIKQGRLKILLAEISTVPVVTAVDDKGCATLKHGAKLGALFMDFLCAYEPSSSQRFLQIFVPIFWGFIFASHPLDLHVLVYRTTAQ